MKKITKAIIPVAGKGTRFLPITKCIAKEIIPIINYPMVYYVVKEAVDAGIEDILFINSYGKNEVLDFFDIHAELESFLKEKGDEEKLAEIKQISNMINISSVRQKEQRGLAHAIYQGKHFVNDNENFCVILGDDLMLNHDQPVIGQLVTESLERESSSVIGVFEVDPQETGKYGIVEGTAVKGSKRTFQMKAMVEKPSPEVAPSNLASPGRYVFSSKIFDYIKNLSPGKNGEFQLTDAINNQAQDEKVYAHIVNGKRFDTGSPLGYLEATIYFGAHHPVYGEDVRQIMQETLKESQK
jgi:UTP--glucose-1-phosphate uridylyltransferase